MDDRGKLEWFLGMHISQIKDCITLDQETYIEIVIEKFSMQDCNLSKTPAENNLKLVKATEDEQLIDQILYRSLVGSLLCIAKQTRPDIIWTVNVLSRFMEQPSNSHWLAGKRVLRYLQATNHSSCSLHTTMNSISLEKATQTGVVITMTEDQQLDTSSNWV